MNPIARGRAPICRCVSPLNARPPSASPQRSDSLCGTGYTSSKPAAETQTAKHWHRGRGCHRGII